jgi:hypothetical protein
LKQGFYKLKIIVRNKIYLSLCFCCCFILIKATKADESLNSFPADVFSLNDLVEAVLDPLTQSALYFETMDKNSLVFIPDKKCKRLLGAKHDFSICIKLEVVTQQDEKIVKINIQWDFTNWNTNAGSIVLSIKGDDLKKPVLNDLFYFKLPWLEQSLTYLKLEYLNLQTVLECSFLSSQKKCQFKLTDEDLDYVLTENEKKLPTVTEVTRNYFMLCDSCEDKAFQARALVFTNGMSEVQYYYFSLGNEPLLPSVFTFFLNLAFADNIQSRVNDVFEEMKRSSEWPKF